MKPANTKRRIAALTLSALLVAFASVRAGEEVVVVVPGDPPLTQATLDSVTRFHTWMLDSELSEAGWKEYQRLMAAEWQTNGVAARQEVMQEARAWGKLRSLKEDKQLALRATRQRPYLAYLRRPGAPQSDKLLLQVCEETHKVLVAGDPPLIQRIVWTATTEEEWWLDTGLTPAQREEYQGFFVEDWKGMDKAARQDAVKALNHFPKDFGKLNSQQKRWLHARLLPGRLEELRKPPANAYTQWALAIYESAHKPGGERNPILVPGEPDLTAEMAASYCDYLEWVMDLTSSGGFNAQQRQACQGNIVEDWRKLDRAGKEEIQATLKRFADLHQSSQDQVKQSFSTEHPRFLAKMQADPGNKGYQWLQAVSQSQKLSQYNLQMLLQMQNESLMQEWRLRDLRRDSFLGK